MAASLLEKVAHILKDVQPSKSTSTGPFPLFLEALTYFELCQVLNFRGFADNVSHTAAYQDLGFQPSGTLHEFGFQPITYF